MAEYQREMVLTMLLAAYLVYLAPRSAVTEACSWFSSEVPFLYPVDVRKLSRAYLYIFILACLFLWQDCALFLCRKSNVSGSECHLARACSKVLLRVMSVFELCLQLY